MCQRALCGCCARLRQFPLTADEAKTRLGLADNGRFKLAISRDTGVLASAAVEFEFTVASRQRADTLSNRRWRRR